MKRISFLAVLFVAFSAMTFTSCDTEPVDPVLTPNPGEEPGGGTAPAVFKVDFSGQTYVATSTIATVGQGLITIGGLKGTNGEMVSLVIEGTGTGTYDGSKAFMDYNDGTSEYSYSNLDFANGEDTGTVIITKIDTATKTISGTFNFVGFWTNDEDNKPSIAFTNGTFENIPYTGGVETGAEFFKATVDGTANSYAGSDLAVAVTDYISFTAVGADHNLAISFPKTITQGTYTFAVGAGATTTAKFIDADDNSYNITGGSLTITSNVNGWVAGSFSYNVTDDAGATIHTVTGGTFNVEWDF